MTHAQRRALLWIDAGPYHCRSPLGRERPFWARLARMGFLSPSRRFGGFTLTTWAHHALRTFT